MITLPNKQELREPLAQLIAETCHCDEAEILKDTPFIDIIEHYDSLAMLEILLSIEAQYGINSDDMLPREYTNQDEIMAHFPKNLSGLIDHMHRIADALNQKENA